MGDYLEGFSICEGGPGYQDLSGVKRGYGPFTNGGTRDAVEPSGSRRPGDRP